MTDESCTSLFVCTVCSSWCQFVSKCVHGAEDVCVSYCVCTAQETCASACVCTLQTCFIYT